MTNLGQSIRGIVMIENGSPKPLISHFQLKKSHYFPHSLALCGWIFKKKARICSSGISQIQKCQKVSKKLAKKLQEQPRNQKPICYDFNYGGAKSGLKAFECESKPIKSIPSDHTVNFYQSKIQKYCIGVKNATFEAKNWPKSGFSAMRCQKLTFYGV